MSRAWNKVAFFGEVSRTLGIVELSPLPPSPLLLHKDRPKRSLLPLPRRDCCVEADLGTGANGFNVVLYAL